jgi:2-polyprenyl-6-methoxyphenol hydroxylase-like FAD-dependent oxidoreductase
VEPVDVIIAGGGAAGPSLAIELAAHGRTSLVVEELERGAYKSPRTMLTNVRSMEHFRRWGIADAHRAADPIDKDFPDDFLFATRLNGYPLFRFENAVTSAGRDDMFSETAEWAPQGTIETTLRERAEATPQISYMWRTRVVGLTQDAGSVRVDVENVDTGERSTLEAPYLAGCDGSRSAVRKALGIRLEGRADLVQNFGWAVRAPELKSLCKVGLAAMYWLVNSDIGSWIAPLDSEGTWAIHAFPCPPELDPDDPEQVRPYIHKLVGAEFPMEFISGGRWVTHSLLAPTFQKGRVFLAGDAVHLMPPTGGFGMNTSIGDAVDLGWKLAATLNGWGGPRLLDTYTEERHQADRFIMDAQEANNTVLSEALYVPGMEDEGPEGDAARQEAVRIILQEKAQEFASLGCQLGYRYSGSSIVLADGSEPPPVSQPMYVPSAHPGCLAPHKWLADGTSLYDLLGPEMTLLSLNGSDEVGMGFERAAEERGVPLRLVRVHEPAVRDLYEADLALVRPDQHVAWRGTGAPNDPGAILDTARGA